MCIRDRSVALDEFTIKTPSGRYPVRSTDVLISSVAPDISIGPTSIEMCIRDRTRAYLNIGKTGDRC